jgi:hypothetical protein
MYDLLNEQEDSFEEVSSKVKGLKRMFETPHTIVEVKWWTTTDGYDVNGDDAHAVYINLGIRYKPDSMDISPTFITEVTNEIGDHFRNMGITTGPVYIHIVDLNIVFKDHYIFNVFDHISRDIKNRLSYHGITINEFLSGHAYDNIQEERLFNVDKDMEKWIDIKIKKLNVLLKALSKGTTPEGVYYEISEFTPQVSQDSFKYVPSEKEIKPHFTLQSDIGISKEKYGEHSYEIKKYLRHKLAHFGVSHTEVYFY